MNEIKMRLINMGLGLRVLLEKRVDWLGTKVKKTGSDADLKSVIRKISKREEDISQICWR